jgi:CRISPR-associated protein Cas6
VIVDVGFRVSGSTIPTDHGFPLYSAVTDLMPALHGDSIPYALHPIRGRQLPGRELALMPHSEVAFRLDHELIPSVLSLAGKTLRVGRSTLTLGVPAVRSLHPSTALQSRLVVIKGFMEPETFLNAVRRQLADLGIQATPGLVLRRSERAAEGRTSAGKATPIKRTIRIHDKNVVGFAVGVEGLSAEESIKLQEVGLGGRRRFGCGVLVPWTTR